MNLIYRVIRYVKLHLVRNPKYFFVYALNYFNPNYILDVKFLNFEEVKNLLIKGKSFIRLGDGEIYMMSGGNLFWQKHDDRLGKLIFNLVEEYDNDSPYVLGLNRVPLIKTNKSLRSLGLFHGWLPSKVYYNLYFNKKIKYMDASIFYLSDTIPKYFESYLKTKTIIIVSNNANIEKLKNNKMPFSSIHYIEVSIKNAFTDYDEINAKVINLASKFGVRNVVVLAAFGPACKALAFELSKKNIQVIDVGGGIEIAYSGKDHYMGESITKFSKMS